MEAPNQDIHVPVNASAGAPEEAVGESEEDDFRRVRELTQLFKIRSARRNR